MQCLLIYNCLISALFYIIYKLDTLRAICYTLWKMKERSECWLWQNTSESFFQFTQKTKIIFLFQRLSSCFIYLFSIVHLSHSIHLPFLFIDNGFKDAGISLMFVDTYMMHKIEINLCDVIYIRLCWWYVGFLSKAMKHI